jgi:hypothetical protein
MPIQIITFDNFYQNIQNDEVRKLFSEMMLARSRGYGPPDYDPHILPFDMTDFVGWHHLFCTRKEGKWTAFGGFKHLTLKTRDAYSIEFPLEAIVKEAHAPGHLNVLQNLLKRCRGEGKNLSYAGSWCIQKEMRQEKAFSQFMKEIWVALMVSDFIERKIDLTLGLGAQRFKTDLFFESVGYRRMTHHGVPLEPIGIHHANNEPVVLMEMSEFSPWAKSCYEKHRFSIRSRIVIQDGQADILKAA